VICAGVDVGSLWLKVVLLQDGEIAGSRVAPTGLDAEDTAEQILADVLEDVGQSRDSLGAVVATGIGRGEIAFATDQASEVVSAARGAPLFHRGIKGVIDLGGETTRIVKLDDAGEVLEFTANEKCAAGTGIFLDAMAKVLGVPIEEMGPLSLQSNADVSITSTCVAFAESEVVSQVHRQTPKADILRGMHRSIATRVFGMAHRVSLGPPIMAIGGLALNLGVVRCLEELLKATLVVPAQPQLVSATGAARIASRMGATT
jgi:(R)-2-hydroxyacyl-CoA dehydratese activating ATPase